MQKFNQGIYLINLESNTYSVTKKIISSEQMEETPRFGEMGNRFVKALAKVKEEVKVLLDVDRLLIEDEIKQAELVIQES